MKKNFILYILLVFLIVVNGFFIYNHMCDSTDRKPKKPQQPTNFIVKELKFSKEQLAQYKESNQNHKETMMRLSADIKNLKDVLFNKLSDVSVDEEAVDSITSLLGQKEKEKRISVFYHFKEIQKICDAKQKEKFAQIINDALHNKGKKDEGIDALEASDGKRKPPPKK
ncbi:hypothetical protein GCM10022393_00380 [Aquimarina addita]|uniref:Periplasmic heavy metal sensor n=1 Tax=Aquimarina addita TaxID=870485 RepID=A0ABP7X6W9_9FLAO